MKTIYHFLVVLLFSATSMGQTTNESLDYYTDLAGNKHYGTIKFKNNNVLEGSVLFSKGDKSNRIPLSEIEYFELASGEKYYSYENKGTYQLLKVLVYGRLTLLTNNATVNKQFYYKKDNEPIVYLELLVLNDVYGKKRPHNIFQKQLHDDLKIDNKEMSDYFKIEYNAKSLTEYTKAYNNSINTEYTTYETSKKKVITLTAYAGASLNSFNFYKVYDTDNAQTVSSLNNFQLGVEMDIKPTKSLSFPFRFEYANKNMKKNYNDFYESQPFYEYFETHKLDINLLRLMGGIRYYVNINKKTKVFAEISNAMYFSDKVNYYVSGSILYNGVYSETINSRFTQVGNRNMNFSYCIGLINNDRFGVEFRYMKMKDNILTDLKSMESINEFALNFRYSFY